MTLLTHRGEGPAFPYAGQPMHILAGHDGQPVGFAAMETTIPPYFAGPIPHAHDEFDEAIYVLTGGCRSSAMKKPRRQSQDRCLPLRVGTGTASATPTPRPPWCWASGRQPGPRWPSWKRWAQP